MARHTRRENFRKLGVAAIAGVPVVLVRADGRFAMVSAAARQLLGRNGRTPRSWSDTILPIAEAGHLAALARRVGKGGRAMVQVVGVPAPGGCRRLEVRLHAGAKAGEVAVLFTEIVHGGAAAGRPPSPPADQAMTLEVQHRVRNALQVMSALIHLETGDEIPAARLEPIRRRILAMAQAHDSLDVRDGVAVVDLSSCIRSIHALARETPVAEPLLLSLEIEGAPPAVSIDVAVPVALIVHEALVAGGDAPGVRIRRQNGAIHVDLSGITIDAGFFNNRLVLAMTRQASILLAAADGGLSLSFRP